MSKLSKVYKKIKKNIKIPVYFWVSLPIFIFFLVFIGKIIFTPKAPTITNANNGYLYTAKNSVFTTYIGNKKNNRPEVNFSVGKGNVVFTPASGNENPTTPTKEGNLITFKNIYENIDFSYQTIVNGVKENIVINKPTTIKEFPFLLDFSGATPKYITDNIRGTVFLDKDQKYLFNFEKPYIVDAKGAKSTNVSLTIKKDVQTGRYVAVIAPDSAWMNDPKRVYPISIDPTIVHNTSSTFATGQLNRVKDTGASSTPLLGTYYQELPTDVNTVGLWHMNETSGTTTVADSSGNAYSGTSNSSTDVGNGIAGNARTFNGTSDYVSIADNSLLTPPNITLETWVNPNTLPTSSNTMRIIGKYNDAGQNSGYALQLYNSSGTQQIRWLSVTSVVSANFALSAGQWSHIAVTQSGTATSIYVNGQLITTGTSTALSNYATALLIGKTASGSYFTGSIDEVRISNIARTPEEIKLDASYRPYSTYTSPVMDLSIATSWNSLSWLGNGFATGDGETATPSASANLVAQWNFNETSGTTASSGGTCGSSCNGTLTNFTSTGSQDASVNSGWTYNNRRWGAGALMFDSSDDYVAINGSSSTGNFGTGDFTVETWVKPNSVASNYAIINKFYNTGSWGDGWFLELTSGTGIRFTTRPNTADTSGTQVVYAPNIQANAWSYIVVTRQSSTLYLYINGILVATAAGGPDNIDSSQVINIGRDPVNGRYFSGAIDSTRLYSRALTSSEIISNYNSSRLEMQTRVGSSADPNDGTWEAWKPITGETQIDSLDANGEKWKVDSNQNSNSTITTVSAVNTGTGNDGACVVNNGTITLDTTAGSTACVGSARTPAYAVNFSDTNKEAAGQTSITVSSTPTGLAAGDEFIIINLQGTSTNYDFVGKYETHIVSSVSTNTLNFTDYPLLNTYDGTTQKIMVQRVPNFSSLTVCGGNTGSGCTAAATLTTTAWDGTKNGVLFFRSTGAVTVNSGGSITVSAKGYRGGDNPTQGENTVARAGESYNGLGGYTSVTNNISGGGGGTKTSGCYASGGAGGGYGLNGTAGGTAAVGGCVGGTAGIFSGTNSTDRLLFGSGGGAGGNYSAGSRTGGAGGGIALIQGSTITITSTGTVSANGANGANPTDNNNGGGGGGAGGTVTIYGTSVTLGSSLVTASAGTGGTGSGTSGGNGAVGRVNIRSASAVSGTTAPIFSSQLSQSQIKQEGNGAVKISIGASQVDSGTVALWHMDETGGTGAYITDSSGHGNNGTPTGTTITDGVIDKGRIINNTVGSTDKITTPLVSTTTGDYTIEAWVKWYANTGSGWKSIFSNGNSGSNGWGLGVNGSSSNYLSVIHGGVSIYSSSTLLDIGTWDHVAVVKSSGTIYIYKNGTQIYQTATTTPNTPTGNSYIGGDIGNENFNGSIDEVRVSTIARSAEEIAEDYRMGRDHRVSETISSTDLSGANKLPFYIASDRLGTFSQLTIGNSAYANYEPDGNTVGFWHLDEQSGSGAYIKDSSGNGNNGTPTGTTSIQGKLGKARYFNGSSYVTIPSSTSLNLSTSDFTLEAWINPGTVTSYGEIIGKGINTDYEIMITDAGKIRFLVEDGGTYKQFDSNSVLQIGKWYYVVGVKTGSNTTGKIYINGVLDATSTSFGDTSTDNSSNSILIGARTTGTPALFFTGNIDEARISNTARTADQIRQAYEIGARTHNITIDFKAKLGAGDLISNTSDTSFIIDATAYGASTVSANLYLGDKIIVKENYNGTDYFAQGTVNSINTATGAVTVTSWDSGSTVPSGGFTVNATVFKWQREYYDFTGSLSTQRNAITRLTYRIIDGSIGANIWLDDLRSSTGYLNTPGGSTITSSTGNRYFQYRAIITETDLAPTSAILTSTTLDYTSNTPPATPSLDLPANSATDQSPTPTFKTTSTDAQSDHIQYKIQICTDSGMSANCQTFDESSSQTGWSGQNADGSTTYTSGTQATYVVQSALTPGTIYYWRSYAIDPAGTNTWSSTQASPYSFTTTAAPTAPTSLQTQGATNPTGVTTLTPYFSAIHNDPDGDSANYYEILVNTASDFSGTSLWDSGKTSMTTTANGARSPNITYAGTSLSWGTVYYWKIKLWDTFGVSGIYSSAGQFTINYISNTPTLDLPTNGATNQIFLPVLKTTAVDNDSDYLRYKIQICTDSGMSVNCQTFDETSSQTGWSGQNTQSSTAYTSGTQAVYTVQTALNVGTTYYWRSYAIDPAGTNTWSSTQSPPHSFSTMAAPLPATGCRIQESLKDTSLTVLWNDIATNEDGYEVQRSVDGGAFSVLNTGLSPNTTNDVDAAISDGHTYQYRVAPYFTTGPTYSSWCTTDKLSLQLGIFSLKGLNLKGLIIK